MDVLITLTTAGVDTGPFNLFSNVDNYTTAFATGVAKSALVAGYLSTAVPTSTNYIRVKSTGRCTNYIDIFVTGSATTTTTTTSGGSPTTTTTTTSGGGGTTTTTTTAGGGPTTTTTTTAGGGPTTTTTTTAGGGPTTTTTTTATPTTTTTTTSLLCYFYNGQNNNLEDATIFWTNCDGSPGSQVVAPSQFSSNFCAREGSVSAFNFTIYTIEPCGTTTTTTTAVPPTTTTTTTSGEWYGYNLFPVTGGTCDSIGPDITAYKHNTGGSIVTGDVLYASQNTNDPLATGYYSDGGFRYESSTGIVTDKTACP